MYFFVRSAFTQIPYGQEIADIATRLARNPVQAWKGASVMEKAYLAVTFERWGEKQAMATARIVKGVCCLRKRSGLLFSQRRPLRRAHELADEGSCPPVEDLYHGPHPARDHPLDT